MKKHRAPMVAALAIAIIIAVWYVALWMPAGARLRTARASEAQALSQVAAAQNQLALLKAEQPKVAAEKRTYANLVSALPNGPSLDQLLRTINAAAGKAGVELTAVGTPTPAGWGAGAPAVPAVSPGMETMTLSIGVSGTTGGIVKFVTALDKQPRIYVVDALSLSPSSSGVQVGTSLTVETFFESAASNDPTFPGK